MCSRSPSDCSSAVPFAAGGSARRCSPKSMALPVFCSDPLSSNAYATEEILRALSLGGLALIFLTPWVGLAVVVLLAVVVVSYRQTCYAYPNGGGAYAVSRENLGRNAALVAASALLVDYVLTVAVSVAAGVDAITSAFLSLRPHAVGLSLLFVAVLALMNLRGSRSRDGLRHPDLRLHRSNFRHDRLGLLAAAYRRCACCRICILRDRSKPLGCRRSGCADRAEGVRPGLHRVDRGRGGQQWGAQLQAAQVPKRG